MKLSVAIFLILTVLTGLVGCSTETKESKSLRGQRGFTYEEEDKNDVEREITEWENKIINLIAESSGQFTRDRFRRMPYITDEVYLATIKRVHDVLANIEAEKRIVFYRNPADIAIENRVGYIVVADHSGYYKYGHNGQYITSDYTGLTGYDIYVSQNTDTNRMTGLFTIEGKRSSQYESWLSNRESSYNKRLKEQFPKAGKYVSFAERLLCHGSVFPLQQINFRNVDAESDSVRVLNAFPDLQRPLPGQSERDQLTHHYDYLSIQMQAGDNDAGEIWVIAIRAYGYDGKVSNYIRMIKKGATFNYHNTNMFNAAYQGSFIEKQVLDVSLNSECRIDAIYEPEYNDYDKLQYKKRYNDGFAFVENVFVNAEVKTLDEIYVKKSALTSTGTSAGLKDIEEMRRYRDGMVERTLLVSILDVGVDYNHPSIAYKIPRVGGDDRRIIGYDYIDNDNLPYDFSEDYSLRPINRGTFIAGLVSPTNEKKILIQPLRVNQNSIAQGVNDARANGARIVVIGHSTFDNSFWSGLESVMQSNLDILFIIAAGDQRLNLDQTCVYPACFTGPNVIKVTSVNSEKELSSFANISNSGRVDLAVNGKEVTSLKPGGGTQKKSTTAASAARAANIAARMLLRDPGLPPEEIKSIMIENIVECDRGCEGYGILDGSKAINAVKEVP